MPQTIGEQLLLVLSGMGTARVNKAIESLLAQNVEALISFGTAGALGHGMKSGDIVVPARILDQNGNEYTSSASWRDNILQQLSACPASILQGDILTADTIIPDAESKQTLHDDTGAIAVDMESALIAATAARHNLPAVTVRVIVDEANITVPASILANTDGYGDTAVAGILTAIIRQPVLIRDLLKLGRMFREAKQNMRWIGKRAEQVLTCC